MKVLILDNIEKTCGDFLKKHQFQVIEAPKLTKEELKSQIKDIEVLLVRSATKVTADIIEEAHSLKLIGRAGAGVDNIDLEAATRKGIIVMNTPGGNTISAAEHTCGMLLSVARLIPQAHGELKQGIWDKKKWLGRELESKTLAVIGLGKIGREVAKRMQAFGMRTIGYDPMLPAEVAEKMGISVMSIEENFKQADFITIHTPYNEATKYLFRKETFEMMKQGVRIVNCARGGIIQEADLCEAVKSGKVAAAALDVFEEEPIKAGHPILSIENIIVTPHIAASTLEAQEKVAIQIAEQIADWKSSGRLTGAVNASAVELAHDPEVQSYLLLAEKLGSIQAQLQKGLPTKLKVIVSGDSLRRFIEPIAAAAVKGFLDAIQNSEINYINVFSKAKELGIVVDFVREKEHPDYTSLIRIEYTTEVGRKLIGGVVLGKRDRRVVMVDNFICEFKPEGNLLIYRNVDKPGVIAGVGAKLLRGNINIANLSLSRNEEKTEALTIISIDNTIDDSVLTEVEKVDGVFDPKIVRLN
ncbi:MAG: phosphoglycerate dehydrogenase [Chloroherpetonaceae bacterium]|nr:phosphoglycerate dehydrogenase [Chloroherpetonaceae bacterium]